MSQPLSPIPHLSREEIRAIYQQGEAVTVAFIEKILTQLTHANARLGQLENRLRKNSRNSSKR